MPSAGAITNERFLPIRPINVQTYPDKPSDVSHEQEDMPPVRRHGPDDDRLERIERAIERLPGNKNDLGAWGRTIATMVIVIVGWIFSALYIAKDTEKEIKITNAVLTTQIEQMRRDFDEYRRNSERDLKLADERYRQLSIALESRGIRMPTK